VISIVLESLALAALGAAAGSTVAWLLFSGDSISLGGPVSTIVATLDVTASTLATGFAWACVVGLLGALLPAIRAARLPVATALRAL
jgi:putative ABC transport system permease protein